MPLYPGIFGSTVNGLVPASGGGTSNFLRADGSFVAPPGGGSGLVGICSLSKTADQSGNFVPGIDLTWDSEFVDSGNWHSNVTNNSRITADATITKAIFALQVEISGATAADWQQLYISQIFAAGGSSIIGRIIQEVNSTNPAIQCVTRAVTLANGDYIKGTLSCQSDTTQTVVASASFFSMLAFG